MPWLARNVAPSVGKSYRLRLLDSGATVALSRTARSASWPMTEIVTPRGKGLPSTTDGSMPSGPGLGIGTKETPNGTYQT